MKIEGNTIIFKSNPENFYKEREGLKSCTIRRISLWSEMRDFDEYLTYYISPFASIGSEGYESIKMGRRFVGIELKKSYYEQAVKNLAIAEKSLSKPKQIQLMVEENE